MSDLRLACRRLLHAPGFTAVAVLTLSLGIGANTAIFSLLDQLLKRPLPVTQPERLALLGAEYRPGEFESVFNYPLFLDYQANNRVFSDLSATATIPVGLGTGGATERQRALLVSGNYFRMLGVNAALGRTFTQTEGVKLDDAPVVVLSHGLWQRRFAADPRILGADVTVNGVRCTVIGVAPREFTGTTRGQAPDLYLPFTLYGQISGRLPNGEHPLETRFFTWHQAIGRLKDGVSHAEAESAMRTLAAQIFSATPANTETNVVVQPGAQGFTQNVREARLPLTLLFATAGLVLLIACANLANLQLARASGRARDFAVRLALGASRVRLLRELLTESLLLSLGGGLLGVVLALWLTEALASFRPPDATFELASGLDLRVLGFALLASIATGVLFGFVPAWRASRPDLLPELKGGGSSAARAGRWNLRSILVVAQVALSLVVLVGAGLCTQSLAKLQKLDPGFDPSQVLLASFDLELNNYSQPQARAFYERLLEQARSLPGVESASLAWNTPLSRSQMPGMSLERIDGFQPPPGENPSADVNFISPHYFRTLGVQVLQGREFTTADSAAAPRVAVVDEAFVARYWPGQDAVGRRFLLHGNQASGQQPIPVEVVGVVRSTRSSRLTSLPRRTMYFPVSQPLHPVTDLTLAVRSGLAPAATAAAIRSVARALDPKVPMFEVRTLEQQKSGSLALQRMAALLLGGFGLLSLALAALGIYGVLAFSVSQRTREIGVRMALGAHVRDVLALVLRQGATLALIGLTLGLVLAGATTRLLGGFLHDVTPLDPATFLGVTLVLSGAALLASWLPARRAARVDPMTALRHE